MTAPTPDEAARRLPTTRVRVADVSGVLSVVPLLLGYQPADGDLVTLGVTGAGRVVAAARCAARDITRVGDGELHRIFRNLHAAGVESAFVIGYGSGEAVTPAMDRVVPVADEDLSVCDALRVEGNRYWSYSCTDLECCPADGREFDRESAASTTLRAEAGMDAASSREVIAARIAAPLQQRAESARQAWDRALQEPVSVADGRQAVRQALASSYEGRQLGDDDVARLAVAMQALPVRDDAWARMTPDRASEHIGFWSDVVRRLPDEAVAGPASMLAFCAWQEGNGALAQIALDRAQTAQPGYSLASLLRQAVSAGVPPSAAVPPMTPEQVEHSYREREAGPATEPHGLGGREAARGQSAQDGSARHYRDPEPPQAGHVAELHDGLYREPDREGGS